MGCPNLIDGIELSYPFAVAEIPSLPADPALLAYLPCKLLMARSHSERRHLGEFYTPPWLVERTLLRFGWPADHSRLVDPTCGAGAFLAGAALALRHDPTAAATRISGADINPLAVLAARVACFCAVADRLLPGQTFDPDIRVADLLDDAPIQPANILVGNPPWIRYSELSPEVRARIAELAKHYDLLPPSSFHGGSELDVSAVFAYRMIDKHLKIGGKAALVVPSSLLRSPASARFRRFTLPDGTPFSLDHVTDFGATRVFSDAGAANRTTLLCWTKGNPHRDRIEAHVADGSSLTPAVARFIGRDRRIALLPTDFVCAHLEGTSEHVRGRKGITTDLNGAYFVRVLGPGHAPGALRVINDAATRGKAVPVHTFDIEEALVFPLLKGAKQIEPFRVEAPGSAVILPNTRVNRIPDETSFQHAYPLAHEHFTWIERETGGALSSRSTYRRMLARAPFFSVYNVGDYTFAPFKVVWAEIARSLVAGLATVHPILPGDSKVIVPDHKVYFAPFDQLEPALFLCALLNSSDVRAYVDATTEKLQVGSLLDRVKLPAFDPKDERHLSIVAFAKKMRERRRYEPSEQHVLDSLVRAVLA